MTEPAGLSEMIDVGRSWDAYWAYLILNNSYFSLVYDKNDIKKCEISNLRNFEPMSFYSAQLSYSISGQKARVSGVYAHGSEIVNKVVAEIGSGIGIASQGLGLHAKKYLGIEISRMATHITNNLANSKMRFLHIAQTRELYDLRNSFDTVIVANVFIHQNSAHVLATMQMAASLLKKGGVLRGNFSNLNPVEQKVGTKYSKDNMDLGAVTFCFWFEDEEIKELAEIAGFNVESIEFCAPHNTRYVKLIKK